MLRRNMSCNLTRIEIQISLAEVFPEATYGAVSMIDQRYALAAYDPRTDSTERDPDDRRLVSARTAT